MCYIFKGKIKYIITILQFEDRNLLSEYHNGTESGDKYDNDLILPPLISESKMDDVSSVDESDAKLMTTDILEDILDRIQSCLSINRRYARYKIRDYIKQRRAELRGALISARKMNKISHKKFKAVVNEIWKALPIMIASGLEVS